MLSFSRLRGDIFWILDELKGGPIKQHYLEIQNLLNNPLNHQSVDVRAQNLSKLLEHAVNTTAFYKSA